MNNDPEANEIPADDPAELEALRQQVAAAEARRMETERTAADLEAQLKEVAISHEVWRHSHARMEHPAIAARLVDHTLISYDPETRVVTGAQQAVESLLTANPKLIARPPRGGGSPAAMKFREPKRENGDATTLRRPLPPSQEYEQL